MTRTDLTGPLRCRPIGEADLDAVVALLCEGFADRPERYWREGLARHRARALPEGYQPYGFMLDHGGRPVGVLLTLHTAVALPGGGTAVRCNLSSWYVKPGYQSQGSLLEKVASRRAEVTYTDVTPSPPTWPVVEARGFKRYCEGQMLAVLPLSRGGRGARARLVGPDDALDELPEAERRLLRDHLDYGCLAVVGTDAAGAAPLVFQRRTVGLIPNNKRFGQVPCLQLIYCRSTGDVARFAAPAGRALLRPARSPLAVLDATGPVPGLLGRYFPGRAVKYMRGPGPLALGDLSYTELVIFGP